MVWIWVVIGVLATLSLLLLVGTVVLWWVFKKTDMDDWP